ncbi:MAG: hypothetical protein OEW89_07540 [Gammaproteobacteria bacterium]|nr:hypothetical protein [Gammaproteobacteria bacterium]
MKKLLYFSLALVLFAVYAEEASVPQYIAKEVKSPEQTTDLQNVSVEQNIAPVTKKLPPLTLESLLNNPSLLESMQELVQEPDRQLHIHYPKNTNNTRLIMELQDKLVALGLPSVQIQITPDEDQASEFLFETEEANFYQEPEQIQEPTLQQEQ